MNRALTMVARNIEGIATPGRRTIEQRLKEARKAEERALKRFERKTALVAQVEGQRRERDRKLDTRRKILAGALALEHMKHDPAFAALFHQLLNQQITKLPERALFGLATIDPDTGLPIETAAGPSAGQLVSR